MKWNKKSRYTALQDAVGWRGPLPVLTEVLMKLFPLMPPDVGEPMTRFYLEGRSQNVEYSGKPVASDSRFYLFLATGRAIVYTIVKLVENPAVLVQLVRQIKPEKLEELKGEVDREYFR